MLTTANPTSPSPFLEKGFIKIKKQSITLPTKFRLVKAMVFPVAMYGCESWTVKEAEHRKIDAFELWCWRSWGQEEKGTTEDEMAGWHH